MLLYRTMDEGIEVEVHRLIQQPSSGAMVCFTLRILLTIRSPVMSGIASLCHLF